MRLRLIGDVQCDECKEHFIADIHLRDQEPISAEFRLQEVSSPYGSVHKSPKGRVFYCTRCKELKELGDGETKQG